MFCVPRPVLFLLAAAAAVASTVPLHGGSTELRKALVLEGGGRMARVPVFADPLEARWSAGDWRRPAAGDLVKADGTPDRTWKELDADKDGWFGGNGPGSRVGTAWFAVTSESNRVAILEAAGHSMAYVNGEPRGGDVYGYGYVRLPVQLRPGTNDIVLVGIRGRARATLSEPPTPVFLNTGDPTLPDFVAGEPGVADAAVVVVNASTNSLEGWSIDATLGGTSQRSAIGPIAPMSVRKVGFKIASKDRLDAGEHPVRVDLIPPARRRSPAATGGEVRLRVRKPAETRKVTFVSHIDGSVQYYGLNPASPTNDVRQPALVLSLHGASVEGIGQASAYAPHPGVHIVSPTNRRPYGFDWEEWGRMDALEVLNLAQADLHTDPRRTYLTGHSMGGHGTWIVGVTFPDRFAAIAPSAGWISFASYAGGRSTASATSAVDHILRRAAASSDTLRMATNYLMQSIYVLHGDADDNVPVTQARTMRKHLAGFHPDVRSHEQPGAGHWWDGPLGGGADCVDWPPIFEMFSQRQLPDPSNPAHPEKIHFVTVNPGVSSKCHWVSIDAQDEALELSEIEIEKRSAGQQIEARTQNVQRFRARLTPTEAATLAGATVDGQVVLLPGGLPVANPALTFEKRGGRWHATTLEPSPARKGPHRNGPLKEGFNHRMLFVYGTRGTVEENAWAFAKARFDAEAFWYRGNGSIDLVADRDFSLEGTAGRGVVLYGNRDINTAWKLLIRDDEVDLRAGKVRIGGREFRGNDLACLFVRPRPDDARACVVGVGGSSIAGMRLTNRLPYFTPGAGFPDCLLVDGTVYASGNAGVVGAGFFGNDWRVATGSFAWRE